MGNSTYFCCNSRADPSATVVQRPEGQSEEPPPTIERKSEAEKHPRIKSTAAAASGGRLILHAQAVEDWGKAPAHRWRFREREFDGKFLCAKEPEVEKKRGTIADGLKVVKANPLKYEAMHWPTSDHGCVDGEQNYVLVRRTGSEFRVQERSGGGWTLVRAEYIAVPPEAPLQADKHTDKMTLDGNPFNKFVRPGRGDGCADVPTVKLFGIVDPTCIMQGSVGDCWLLSALAGLAEFEGAIKRLFRNTADADSLPAEGANNMYTVTLYDLASWQPVDVVVDERLCCKEDGTLLGCKPSLAGELWACYLEKAVAVHCGGWDKICGGNCPHAWRLLTGCRDQYTIRRTEEDDASEGFLCLGTFNHEKQDWEPLTNSPRDSFSGLWPMPWPEVGGGGEADKTLTEAELFVRMCAWEDSNYVMACSTKHGSDAHAEHGIVDGHAYAVLKCVHSAGGTEVHMVQVRNPWGRGEYDEGRWTDDGPGWGEHPEVKEALKPVKADDGVFWMDVEEFFKYFKTVFLCAHDMADFVGSEPSKPPQPPPKPPS